MPRPASRRLAPPALLALLAALAAPRAEGQTVTSVMRDVSVLAADSLQGRFSGTPGARAAAEYVAARFRAVGLEPAGRDFLQEFPLGGMAASHGGGSASGTGLNVVGVLRGTDRSARDVVIVGAHYDHLGTSGFGVMDPDSATAIHNGADDNASGTAALIAIAEQLRQRRPKRTVLFIAFSGEELGLLGSQAFVRQQPELVENTLAMVNLDMVGRLRNERLIVYGTGTAAEFPALLDSLNAAAPASARFALVKNPDGYGPSDQTSFYAARRPVLHLFTDLHEDYHRATDDVALINGPGLLRVARFTAQLVRTLSDRAARLTFVEQAAPVARMGGGGYGAYLGTVPDMAASERGVRLSGVRKDSPAAKAGLQRDDVIVKIGARVIDDLQAMTDALREHRPGDVVMIVVQRDGKETTLTATLGSRGG